MNTFWTFIEAVTALSDEQRQVALGGESLCLPPGTDQFDYWCTPKSAIIFACMGVDGVHYAILPGPDGVTEASPVLHISPMDSDEPYSLLGHTFVDYLATGCRCHRSQILDLASNYRNGKSGFAGFIAKHFDGGRFDLDGFGREYKQYLEPPSWDG